MFLFALNSVFFSAFAEAFDVSVNALFNDNDSLVSALDLINGSLLALQLLVNTEEVRHFIKNMSRKLTDIVVAVVGGVIERDSDDLVIGRTVVYHRNNADRIALNQRQRINRFGAKHQNVQRVAVLGICSGDKAVVCGLVSGGIKHTVEHKKTRLFVQLIFHFAALFDLNDRKEIVFRDSVGVNIMPNVHFNNPFRKAIYSTVTDFARFLGLSTLFPL